MSLELKPVYGVSEIAEMLDWSRFKVYRWVKKQNLANSSQRNERLDVPVTRLREEFPDVWDSILLCQSYDAD